MKTELDPATYLPCQRESLYLLLYSIILYSEEIEKRCEVVLSAFVQKRCRKLPDFVLRALRTWTLLIEEHGIRAMRRIPGYHDEPLKGVRTGQRSSRLGRAYRVIYEQEESGENVVILVVEVNKHEY